MISKRQQRRTDLNKEWNQHLDKCGMCKDSYAALPNAGADDFPCAEGRALGRERGRESDLIEALDLLLRMFEAWTVNKDDAVPSDLIRNAGDMLARKGYGDMVRPKKDR